MASGRRTGWRWSNVPVPEPHVAGLLVGSPLVVGWATRAMGAVDAADPGAMVTDGPHAHSRNPMYVAWTGVYAGVALIVNSVWLLVLLPAVVVATHRTIRREERSLEVALGEVYRACLRDVRRYVQGGSLRVAWDE